MQQRGYTRTLLGLWVIGVLAGAMVMTDRAQAQTTANGPYYATPSWDQTLPSATRFVILSNFNGEAVLDRNTGLVWEKSPDARPDTWFNARVHCANRTTGNQRGWRLPSLFELSSLMDPTQINPTQNNPALPLGHPFLNVLPAQFYWSATTDGESSTKAWQVFFFDGSPGTINKFNLYGLWCVRGGNNADTY